MQAPLGGEGDDDDEGADPRHDPRRRELQRRRLRRFPAAIRHPASLRHRTLGPVFCPCSCRCSARRRAVVVVEWFACNAAGGSERGWFGFAALLGARRLVLSLAVSTTYDGSKQRALLHT